MSLASSPPRGGENDKRQDVNGAGSNAWSRCRPTKDERQTHQEEVHHDYFAIAFGARRLNSAAGFNPRRRRIFPRRGADARQRRLNLAWRRS